MLWSESLAPAELLLARTLDVLRASSAGVRIAVFPRDVAAIGGVVRDLRARGVWTAVWPMLADADGRWCFDGNVTAMTAHVRRALDACRTAAALPDELVLDFEPPIDTLRRLLALDARAALSLVRAARRSAADEYGRVLAEARTLGLSTTVAVVPMAVLDGDVLPLWQPTLATHVPWAAADRVSVMLYTSLLEQFSRGLLRRRGARAVLRSVARRAARRFGARAEVSLGVLGRGALGTEQCLRSWHELEEDVTDARRAGVGALALFELRGVLGAPDPARWIRALAGGAPADGAAQRQ